MHPHRPRRRRNVRRQRTQRGVRTMMDGGFVGAGRRRSACGNFEWSRHSKFYLFLNTQAQFEHVQWDQEFQTSILTGSDALKIASLMQDLVLLPLRFVAVLRPLSSEADTVVDMITNQDVGLTQIVAQIREEISQRTSTTSPGSPS